MLSALGRIGGGLKCCAPPLLPSLYRWKSKRPPLQLGLLPRVQLRKVKPSWARFDQGGRPRLPWGAPLGPQASQGLVQPNPGPSRTFLLEPSETFHKIPEPSRHFRNNSRTFQYMNLILRTIPDLLVISRIPSETPNKLRSPKLISDNSLIYSKRHLTLSVSPYGSRIMQT